MSSSRVLDGVNQSLDVALAISYPYSAAGWFKLTDNNDDHIIIALGDVDVGFLYDSLLLEDDDTKLKARTWDGSMGEATSGDVVSYGAWHHGVAVFTSASSRTLYLDGDDTDTETTTQNAIGVDNCRIGAAATSGPIKFAKGKVALMGVWDKALSGANAASLFAGALPSAIEAGNLVAYWFDGTESDNDHKGAYNLTANNSPTWDSGDWPIGGVEYTRTASDTVSLSDTLIRTVTYIRPIIDTLGITDVLTRETIAQRIMTDSLGLTDALSRTTVAVRTLADSEGMTDSLSAVIAIIRSIADSVGITDALSRATVGVRVITDALGITDSLTKALSAVRSMSESLAITDSLVAFISIIRTIADNVDITDALSRIQTTARTISDTLGITDALSRVTTFFRSITDALGLTDSLTGAIPTELVSAWVEQYRRASTITKEITAESKMQLELRRASTITKEITEESKF